LTPAISPNVGNSIAKFLLVEICVRASPFKINKHFVFDIIFTRFVIFQKYSSLMILIFKTFCITVISVAIVFTFGKTRLRKEKHNIVKVLRRGDYILFNYIFQI